MEFTKNKIIFDLEALKPGTAIKYNYKRHNEWINALIVNSEFEELEVVIYDGEDNTNTVYIDINEVLENSIEIKILS